MPFCIPLSQYDENIHDLVSGPSVNCTGCGVDVPTPGGLNVRLDPIVQSGSGLGFSLVFSEVSSPGITTFSTSGCDITGCSVEFTTTASHSGDVLLVYVLPQDTSPEDFASFRIFCSDGTSSFEITVTQGPNAPDYQSRTVCGLITAPSELSAMANWPDGHIGQRISYASFNACQREDPPRDYCAYYYRFPGNWFSTWIEDCYGKCPGPNCPCNGTYNGSPVPYGSFVDNQNGCKCHCPPNKPFYCNDKCRELACPPGMKFRSDIPTPCEECVCTNPNAVRCEQLGNMDLVKCIECRSDQIVRNRGLVDLLSDCRCECPDGYEECGGGSSGIQPRCRLICPSGQTRNPDTCECYGPSVSSSSSSCPPSRQCANECCPFNYICIAGECFFVIS